MQKKLYILVTLLLLQCSPFGGWGAFAQTYPVTISTQLTQPSPIYLSNYANTASINSPIKVQLILNDLSIMNRQVRLKCYFQGAVSFVTNDFVVGAAPIYLEGGFPTQLTNVELGSYFEFQNIKGINPNQYGQPLPEGIYTISFEVYDFASNKKLSKKSSVTTVIFQNEPPFLNLPANQAEIMEQNIQNIVFSWTPRSINVSNVEYEFSLVEIWNSNTPIQNAFAYSPPLYTTTTRNTTVQYSIAEPQLIPGKTYAWRVKAKALVGAEEIGVFKNNGYSETYSFKYLTFCKPPMAITATDVSQEQAKVTWSGAVDNFDYQVNYREKNADSKWYKLVTPREYALISNLKPKTTYEYTVGAACDPGEYTHSNIQDFTTLAQDEIAFTGCGIKPDPTALSNKTPLPALFPNDVVTAGDFPIVVLKSTGSNGTFSGEGYVTLPFLEKFRKLIDAAAALAGSDENGDSKANIGKYTRIRITFKNIGVNTDFKLISGEIVASYDPKWGSMIDGDKLVNDVLGDTGTVIPIDVQFEIKSVVKNADGTLTITGTNGVVVTQPKTANDVIISDRNGKQYAVSPNAPVGNIESTGKIAPGGVPTPQNTNGMGSGGNIKQISSPDVSITFAAGTGFYSLDENPNQDPKLKGNTKLNNTYDVIPKKDGTNYYVHYKAVSDAPKAEDYITAKATFSNGKTAADIVFKTENGTEIPSTWSGNVATLTLKRTLDFAKESILATVKPPVQKDSVKVTAKYDIAGTLNMWHVTSKKVNVTLVGLNGGQTPTQSQAQEYLNSIYGKAGIQFEVSTIKVDIAKSWDTSIETGDSDLLNTYTDGQQTIITDFQTQLGSSYKNNTYYVLFTGVPASKSGVLGFMPLKRQFGFIFAPPSGAEPVEVRTLAHELGHGVFGLQHPFTDYSTTVTTDLLMDYGTGTALSHNDWEIIHAPGLQLYQFTQGSSAGALQDGSVIVGIDVNGDPIKFDISKSCNQFFVGKKLAKFDDNEIKKINKLYITASGELIKVTDEKNNIYNLSRRIIKDKNNPTLITGTYEASQLICSTCIESDITKGNVEKGVKREEKTDALGKVVVTYSGISVSSRYVIANFATLKDCKVGEEIVVLKGNTFECRKITQNECNGQNNSQDDNQGNIVIVRDCGTNTFEQVHNLNTAGADGTKTWGDKMVKYLDLDIKNNSKNKYGDNLSNINTDDLKYINPGSDYFNNDMFKSDYIKELNQKLAYLEVSSGVQTYIRFVETTCTFTEQEGTEFAEDIFKYSKSISKENGIYVLVVRNYNASHQLEWKTYFAFGNKISASIKLDARSLLKINETKQFTSFGQSLIQFYQQVPKNQLQYIYVIEKVTTEEIKNAPTKSFLTKNILRKIVTVKEQKGNAIQAIYLFKDTQTNNIVALNEKENINRLKEQYVADESLNLAQLYADKYADWRLSYFDFNKPEYEDGIVSIVPHISECKFTLNKTCIEQYIDDAFLVAGIASIPFGNVAVVIVDGLAIVYYATKGDLNTAMMYLGAYGVGPVVGEVICKIAEVYPTIVKFKQNLIISIQLEKGLDEVAVKTLLNKELSKEANKVVVEYLIPHGTYKNAFVKATENEIVTGYIKVENGTENLVVLAEQKGTNLLSKKLTNATDVEVREAFESLIKTERFIAKSGSELKTYLSKLTNKPVGKTYTGDVFRSLGINSEKNFGAVPNKMTSHEVWSSWGRYDLAGEENAMYLSKTEAGNKRELVPHYGGWSEFSTYKYSNVKAANLLDLTDDVVRRQLATQFDDLTKVLDDKAEMYEFTNELASWARKKGYNGMIVPGARGTKDYENIILFEQKYIDDVLENIKPERIIKETQLSKLANELPTNLRAKFLEDFTNASDDVSKALLKENSELLSGWKNFRKNHGNEFICN
ncbi:hypothetical protein FNW52_15870 [Flavobacterium sp. ZT3R18]|uniref:fibronectin type III domain-containing protein n=1 Tax=Flavobacterium sp. ZT3R18 TaxID=2594429 RepID=UPI00117A2064|nr:fibronectin type III domain-containing protein [Flavobacterium sp. ZT3R18]TRX33235.1 hypothetical protein FNW52_15870 [Flavobacterium sp. ZT3R18]